MFDWRLINHNERMDCFHMEMIYAQWMNGYMDELKKIHVKTFIQIFCHKIIGEHIHKWYQTTEVGGN